MKCLIGLTAVWLATGLACGCGGGGGSPDAAATCDQACMDAIALLSLRDAIKLVFNRTLQGQPVGSQDQTTMCPLGGTAHVFGQATSNANQGTTTVDLTYELKQCAYAETGSDPTQAFSMTLTGIVTESGTIAVQPSTTTSLQFDSAAMTFSGTVTAPPILYNENACAVILGQIGNDLSGTMCGRVAGVVL